LTLQSKCSKWRHQPSYRDHIGKLVFPFHSLASSPFLAVDVFHVTRNESVRGVLMRSRMESHYWPLQKHVERGRSTDYLRTLTAFNPTVRLQAILTCDNAMQGVLESTDPVKTERMRKYIPLIIADGCLYGMVRSRLTSACNVNNTWTLKRNND
jgi:hypothetical protein